MIRILGLVALLFHSGGLDSQGGHFNRATGDYHFHDGLSESKPSGRRGLQRSAIDRERPVSSTNRNIRKLGVWDKVFAIILFGGMAWFVYSASTRR